MIKLVSVLLITSVVLCDSDSLQPQLEAPPPQQLPRAQPPFDSTGVQPVEVQMPALRFFCDGRHAQVLRYLEASPNWRVAIETREGADRVVAYKREGRRVTLNGYSSEKNQTRVGFVLADSPGEPQFAAPCVTVTKPDAGQVQVSLCTYTHRPIDQQARLFVGVTGLWLSVIEINEKGRLDKTPGLLATTERELEVLRGFVEQDRPPLAALPPDQTQRGAPILTIDDSEREVLHIEAWVNPAEAGVTEIRAKATIDGNQLTVSHSHLYARERVGFSDDPNQLFYLNSLVFLKETATGWESKHDLVFQLWFKPDSGGPERLIIEKRQTISGYEH